MRRLYKPLLNSVNRLSAGMMSLLGFGRFSCENATDAYGSPHTEFQTKCRLEITEPVEEGIQFEMEPSFDYAETKIRAYTKERETTYPSIPALATLQSAGGKLISFNPENKEGYLKKEDLKNAISWIKGEREKEVSITMKH